MNPSGKNGSFDQHRIREEERVISSQWARGLRIAGILKRFTSDKEMALSDRAFVEATIERWRADLPREIVDVGE